MTFATNSSLKNAPSQKTRSDIVWLLWFVVLMGVTAVVGLAMYLFTASFSTISWLLYLIGIIVIIYEPRYGIYLIVFFSLAGDFVMMPWYPFNKNFSSNETLLFLHNAVIFSPLEFYLTLTFASWLGRAFMQRNLKFYKGDLFWPTLSFVTFVAFGLVYGIGTGGNLNTALWSARSIFYMPMLLILISNLFTKREHVSNLMWVAMIALCLEGFMGVYIYFVELGRDLSLVEDITEHSAAIHMNTLFVFTAAVWLYKGSWAKRFILPFMIPPVFLTYLATQRRAAFVALFIALAFMAVFLYQESRKVFFVIMPIVGIVGILYLGAFWNSSGAIGLPAQAIKSIIAEDDASEADRSSNVYRDLENINSNYTIHQRPLTGIGFGQPFYMLVTLPDISTFVWWEFITHNSIAWVWMKTGVGGFFTMMFLVGISITLGIRVLWRMPHDDMSAIAATAVLYIVMHFIYAYVDMSWNVQNMVYLGVMLGFVNRMEYIVDQPIPIKHKRWSWQPDPLPPSGLLPLFNE